MYEVKEANYIPDNFYLGGFPALTETGTIKEGAAVRKHAPVALCADGLAEATAETLNQLVGITADDPDDGGNVVYYQTGTFGGEAIVLPEGVTLDALKAACRPLSIFLK